MVRIFRFRLLSGSAVNIAYGRGVFLTQAFIRGKTNSAASSDDEVIIVQQTNPMYQVFRWLCQRV
jgi:hypothetical protein